MNADKRFFRLRFRNSCGVHQEGDLLQIAQTIMPSLHRTFGYGVKIILIRENPSRSVFIRARIYDCFRSDPQTIDGCTDELRRTGKAEFRGLNTYADQRGFRRMNADKRFFRLRFRNSCGVHQEGDLLQIAQTIMPSLHRTFGYGVKIILIRENPSRSVFIRARIYDCFRSDPQTIDGCADELRRTGKTEFRGFSQKRDCHSAGFSRIEYVRGSTRI